MNIFLREGDYIGNPLIQTEYGSEGVALSYRNSSLGLWNISRKVEGYTEVYSGLSLSLLHETKAPLNVKLKRMFNPGIKFGYKIPTTMEELISNEYMMAVSIFDMGLSKEVLKEIEGSSFATTTIYQMTGKKVPGEHVLGIKEQNSSSRSQETQAKETNPELRELGWA